MDKNEEFKRRAENLRQPVKEGQIISGDDAILVFMLSDEKYALEAKYISRVVSLKKYTELPCTPDHIMGIINVESRILALINIKKLFQLPDKGITNLNRVILLEHNGIEFGVLVDEVTGREQIDFAELRTGLPDIAGLDRKLICGVTPDRVIVINTQNLIADKKLYINEKV